MCVVDLEQRTDGVRAGYVSGNKCEAKHTLTQERGTRGSLFSGGFDLQFGVEERFAVFHLSLSITAGFRVIGIRESKI